MEERFEAWGGRDAGTVELDLPIPVPVNHLDAHRVGAEDFAVLLEFDELRHERLEAVGGLAGDEDGPAAEHLKVHRLSQFLVHLPQQRLDRPDGLALELGHKGRHRTLDCRHIHELPQGRQSLALPVQHVPHRPIFQGERHDTDPAKRR